MRKRLLTAALAFGLFSSSALALTLGRPGARAGRGNAEWLSGAARQDKETLELVKQINAAERKLSAAGG